MRTLIGVMLLSLSLPAMSGTVYKWKDARGVVHYSDSRPPAGVKYDTQDFASTVPAPSEAAASPEAPAPSSENARCEKSRQSVAALSQTGVPVMMDLDGDGRAEALSPDTQQRQLELAKAQEKAFCPQ